MRIIWPSEISTSDKASIYLRDCFPIGQDLLIKNVDTQVAVLDTRTQQFPLTINDGNATTKIKEKNSYVVSPLSAYTDYALEEIARIKKPLLTFPLVILVYIFRFFLSLAKVDKIVHINNWLLSTNIYPQDWLGEDVDDITTKLCDEFPDYVFAFRSLNESSNKVLIRQLESVGYVAVPSRQVYLFDGSEKPNFLNNHNTKLDAKLLEKTDYEILSASELTEADFSRLEELYNLLYLDKYCRLNPQYSARWLKCGGNHGWLDLKALKNKSGVIDGVVGWFSDSNTITAPIVGYDTSLPQSAGLYRLLTQLCLQRAVSEKKLLNFSSGAAHFKRLRGGQPSIEYTMVYINHLGFYKRFVWKTLSFLLHLIAVPLMRKLKL